jgi:hypothetical protein
MLLKEEKIQEAEKLIDDFKMNFKKSIGSNIIITYMYKDNYTIDDLPILTLKELENIINKFVLIENKYGLKDTVNITGNTRKWEFVKFKHIFYKLADDMKFGPSASSKYLNQTHATAINGRNKCLNLLETQDLNFTKSYNEIITYIKLIYEYE